ncbi:MAG: hypothetical protein QOF78_2374 [Phycisphaerales bacterium]|nr:hypothetical protein [Phycisphaerales bacterium]
MNRKRAVWFGGIAIAGMGVAIAIAQTPPSPPVVVGRDMREAGQVIGKENLLRVRLVDVAGPGVQQVRVMRVAPDGNITLPRIAPLRAEGVAIATLEAQANALYKPIAPTGAAFISIADKNPPAPPPPPASAPATAPATTRAATQPATAPATAPAPVPAAK